MIALNNKGFTQADFDENKKKIIEKEEKVQNLSEEIDLLSKNNKMLQILSSLSVDKQVVIEYRDNTFKEKGNVRCPVCGSEAFATMEEQLILKEADEYIKQNGEFVKKKEREKSRLLSEIDALYSQIINCAKLVVKKEKEALETEIRDLKVLKDETQSYFDEVKKLQKAGKTINIGELTPEKVGELLASIKSELLKEAQEQKVRETYQKILEVLGYEYQSEDVKQTYAKVENLINKSFEISNFSYDVFVSKLNAIESVLANQTLSDLNQKLENDKKKNQKLDAEIRELQNLNDVAVQRAKDIENIVEKLSKDEYEKVGPALNKFYNKLTRFKSSDGINIIQEKDGISLVDNKGKNIVNVLSNGQISVFMLAYFFAGINARNDREKMKIYFIDDLTACMDDVNMLAFMDLLKYQMSSKETMEQLFFLTCDERISNLLKYKFKGRGIELCELLEKDLE